MVSIMYLNADNKNMRGLATDMNLHFVDQVSE